MFTGYDDIVMIDMLYWMLLLSEEIRYDSGSLRDILLKY